MTGHRKNNRALRKNDRVPKNMTGHSALLFRPSENPVNRILIVVLLHPKFFIDLMLETAVMLKTS